jgi:hypothetical protein
MDRISKISHKGKEIILLDFSNLNNTKEVETIIEVLNNVYPTLSKYPEKSVLTLTNVEGLFFNGEVLSKFTEVQKKIKPHLKKGAVVGIHGLQKVAYEMVAAVGDHTLKSFDTETAAKDWLVE